MRKLVCAGLALCLLLGTGCSRMLEREYTSVEKHYEQYMEDDSSALVVRNYIGLKNALLYLVGEAQEYGVIRVYDYAGDVSADLTELCLSIKQDVPLGAYAVDYTSHEKVTLVAYTELRVYITYRRTAEQIQSIQSVQAEQLEDILRQALLSGQEELILQLSYYAHDVDRVSELFGELVAELAPADPLPYTISFYPETGVQHIIELQIDYPGGARSFLQRAESIRVARQAILSDLEEDWDEQTVYRYLAETLRTRSAVDETAADDAYGALVARCASGQGFAEGFADLCRTAGLECIVVAGQRDGAPWYWNMVQLEQGYYHVDLLGDTVRFLADSEMSGEYVWTDCPASGQSLMPTVPAAPPPEAGEAEGSELPGTED